MRGKRSFREVVEVDGWGRDAWRVALKGPLGLSGSHGQTARLPDCQTTPGLESTESTPSHLKLTTAGASLSAPQLTASSTSNPPSTRLE